MNVRVKENLVSALEKLTLYERKNEARFFVPLCDGHNFRLFQFLRTTLED